MDLRGNGRAGDGRGSGIGEALCARLAAAGARVGGRRPRRRRRRAGGRGRARASRWPATSPSDTRRWPPPSPRSRPGAGASTSCASTPASSAGQSGIDDLDVAAYRRVMGVNVDHVVFGLDRGRAGAAAGGRRHGDRDGVARRPRRHARRRDLHPEQARRRRLRALRGAPWRPRGSASWRCARASPTPRSSPAVREQFGEFPLLTAEDVADAVEAMIARGEPGECWFVQPGREPRRSGSGACPGPKGGGAPPPLTGRAPASS